MRLLLSLFLLLSLTVSVSSLHTRNRLRTRLSNAVQTDTDTDTDTETELENAQAIAIDQAIEQLRQQQGLLTGTLDTNQKFGFEYYHKRVDASVPNVKIEIFLTKFEELCKTALKAQMANLGVGGGPKRGAGGVKVLPMHGAFKNEDKADVPYFDDKTLAPLEVVIDNKLLMDSSKKNKITVTNAIFVHTEGGKLYMIEPKAKANVKHSSLSNGKDVRMAGEITVKDGEIIQISNGSGHYRPPVPEFHAWLKSTVYGKITVVKSAKVSVKDDDKKVVEIDKFNETPVFIYTTQ